MKKVAIIAAMGCEEIETLTPLDILRRLDIKVDLIGLYFKKIIGAHQIIITCDKILDNYLVNYDMVILPGGKIGTDNLKKSITLMKLMKRRKIMGKWNAAICSGPIALAYYGLLNNCHYTCYPGAEKNFKNMIRNSHYLDDIVVIDRDNKLVTSQGPATSMQFSFSIANILGINPESQEQKTLYDYLRNHI